MKKIPCNVCGSEKSHLLVTGRDLFYKIDDSTFPIVVCDSCGLVYQNPQLDPEELKKYYPADYGPYQDNYSVLKYGRVLALVKKNFNYLKSFIKPKATESQTKPGDQSVATFLDFGSGSGAYLEKMRRLHPKWDLHGLDNSEFACRATREKGFTVYCGDLMDVALPENFFDHVYMGQVIEHLHDPKRALQKLHGILKSGGTLVMGTPNIDSVAAKVFGYKWFGLEVPRHLFLFSPKTISHLLRDTGFEVKKITFDREPKTAIRSIDYVLGGHSVGMNPLLWHTLWYLLLPISIFLSYRGKTSIMVVHAVKK